jgi:hypothetical protein
MHTSSLSLSIWHWPASTSACMSKFGPTLSYLVPFFSPERLAVRVTTTMVERKWNARAGGGRVWKICREGATGFIKTHREKSYPTKKPHFQLGWRIHHGPAKGKGPRKGMKLFFLLSLQLSVSRLFVSKSHRESTDGKIDQLTALSACII